MSKVRRFAIAAAACVGVAALIAVIGLPLFVAPPEEEIGQADLIYVIGPPKRERVAVERELRASGVASLSLYSVADHGGWSASRLPVCREPNVHCVHPEPFTTKGEIAFLSAFAEQHEIDRTVILTFTPHVLRTRYILAKCFPGDAVVVAVDQNLHLGEWIYQYAYQTTALAKAWLTPCSAVDE